jgi:hypothetical protein
MSPRLFLVLIVVAALLSGCGWKGSGTVVERDYDRPYTTTTERCSTRTTGTTRTRTCQNDPVYHPANFSLLVRDGKGENHWVSVSERDYNTHPVGSKFQNGQ